MPGRDNPLPKTVTDPVPRKKRKERFDQPAPNIDIDALKKYLQLKPSLHDTAARFGCHFLTIEKFINTHFKERFMEFREKCMEPTRAALVSKAIKMALEGNVQMLVFCLKNLCGWDDKTPVQNNLAIGMYMTKEKSMSIIANEDPARMNPEEFDGNESIDI
jgi:hypothetical protein